MWLFVCVLGRIYWLMTTSDGYRAEIVPKSAFTVVIG